MTLLQQLSGELERLVAASAPAVVGIEHARGQGSGVVLAPDGYLLTNHHVLGRGRRFRVRFASGVESEGSVVGSDPATDLAVVRVPNTDLTALPLAPLDRVEVGQLVIAIGNPFHFERSVSLGVVSALDRTINAPVGHAIEGVVQTDAAINPGNSGGPLINAWGEIVGINTAIVPYARGIGFAIPAQTAHWVAGLLIQKGSVSRRYLGVAVKGAHLTPALAAEVGQERAVRILAAEARSPASEAGAREGDLLLALDGAPLTGVGELHRLLATREQPALQLDIWRRGERLELTVRPADRRAA